MDCLAEGPRLLQGACEQQDCRPASCPVNMCVVGRNDCHGALETDLSKMLVLFSLCLFESAIYSTNNDLDSIGYLFKLPFLLYCMTLGYLYVRRLMKNINIIIIILSCGPVRGALAYCKCKYEFGIAQHTSVGW